MANHPSSLIPSPENSTGAQDPIAPNTVVRYIKLGESGSWERECLAKGLIRFGFGSSTAERFPLCTAGKWEALTASFIHEGKDKGTATRFPSLTGTCGTCHDTPNVGDHSFPTPLNIGTGDPNPSNASSNLGGLDLSYLPTITVCKTDPGTGLPTSICKTTTDLGQALIDGNFDHVGKIKGPILRGLSARAPYFHNGSARTLLDVVHFYETRFGLTLTSQQESDLVAFLGSL